MEEFKPKNGIMEHLKEGWCMLFYTADLCDQHPRIEVVAPRFHNYGGAAQCAGEIVTIRLDEDNTELIALLKEEGAGRVVVVDVEGAYCAVVGENLTQLAHDNGWNGIVVNGYVRDIEHTRTIHTALWALGTCPRKSLKKAPAVRDIPLLFGGVTFTPGHYLYADWDGIVLSPTPLI